MAAVNHTFFLMSMIRLLLVISSWVLLKRQVCHRDILRASTYHICLFFFTPSLVFLNVKCCVVCIKALMRVTNDLLLTPDAEDCSVLILLDLSASFDTVDHTILIDCLKHWAGISGSVQSFLPLT